MKKNKFVPVLAVLLIMALALVGCGSKATSSAVKDGAVKMQAALADVQKAVDKGDAAAATKAADALEAAWASFEDSVKDQSKETYEKIEEPLGLIRAGAKQEKLDQKMMTEQIKALGDLLTPLTK